MNKLNPPSFAKRFFLWYCNPRLQETILGDMEEQFEEDVREFGVRKAKLRFTWTTIRFFRRSIIKPVHDRQKLNYYGMFRHNLLITFRGFKRHKISFGINLVGLVASFTCVLFSAFWITDELKKDRFHDDPDKLFQVYSRFFNTDGISVWQGVTGLLEKEIEANLPQVEASAVFTDVHEYTLSYNNERFKSNGRFADEDFLETFNYPLIAGTKDVLADPSKIIITQSLAKKLFGEKDAIGQSITWQFWSQEKTFQVGGILEDITSASSQQFNFILPWTFYHDELISFKAWGNYYGRVIVKFKDLSQKQLVEEKINEIFKSNHEGENVELFLTNYSDQYLYGNYENGQQAGGRIDYVYLTMVVAIFILLIACINFINLSTAYSSLKAKEIGVKKSFGAKKSELAFQFFFESILLSTMAIVMAVILVYLFLEPFNQLTGKQLSFTLDPIAIGAIVLFIPLIGIIAGLYPALYLSGMNAISALKKNSGTRHLSTMWSRKVLVIIQFTLSVVLIVATMVVGKQMDFALTKNLGYERDNLIYFLREGNILENREAFVRELENVNGVKMVSETGFSILPDMQNRTAGVSWEGKTEDQLVQFWENNGDLNSIKILGLELIAGRSFDDQLSNDENSIIFNETAINAMGIQDPIGKTVSHYTGDKKIIGVVKDFTTESLHKPMEPALFLYRPERAHYVMAKVEKGKELQAIEQIESLYKQFNPNYPFNPIFLDQDYQIQYDAEMRVSRLSQLFSGLAILISCLGLFGLTIFQVQRRIKEIGIRKVLGCSSWKLALSMTFQFTKSVFVSLIIALPISYFLGINWLENFAEHIELEWWLLTSAGLLALLIAWLTVGSQTFRAASANPVESLRDE